MQNQSKHEITFDTQLKTALGRLLLRRGLFPVCSVLNEMVKETAVCRSKQLEYLFKNTFFNLTSLLEHREEDMK